MENKYIINSRESESTNIEKEVQCVVEPGKPVCIGEEFMIGYGLYKYKDKILSNTYGNLEVINKLVVVNPIYTFFYRPQCGDVIIGKISSLGNRQWNIECKARLTGTLSLSTINLPGPIQRRKVEIDEMTMCSFFDINDVICCEIQKTYKNGSFTINTRNLNYTKLEKGVLAYISHFLITKTPTQTYAKENILIIVGLNGNIWLGYEEPRDETLKLISFLYRKIQEHQKSLKKISLPYLVSLLETES